MQQILQLLQIMLSNGTFDIVSVRLNSMGLLEISHESNGILSQEFVDTKLLSNAHACEELLLDIFSRAQQKATRQLAAELEALQAQNGETIH